MSRKLFCDMNPLFFEISSKKEVLRRHIKNLRSKECFSKTFSSEKLPNIVTAHRSHMIKHGPGIDPVLQYNKAENIAIAGGKINGIIVRPGESFSFWGTVGKITKRKGYKAGRVLRSRKVVAGLGGGLCNLANTLHLLILNTPMTVTEFHSHSDALAPDEGKRVPFSAGTSVCYNYMDYRFRNDTDQAIQILLWCDGDDLCGEVRSEREYPWRYEIVEEDHHFQKEGEKYNRISKIYRNTIEKATGNILKKELILDNHSKVMYDPELIPKELIRS